MPEFIMPLADVTEGREFHGLDEFTRGYVEAIFFTECHSDNPELEDCTFGDLAPETLARIVEDCADFQKSLGHLLARAHEQAELAGRAYSESSGGIDFWLTRNGHGAGFWDRGLGAVGDELTAMAKPYGSCDLYKGDNGKLYLA